MARKTSSSSYEALRRDFANFVAQYERDMRGDMSLDESRQSIGIINELRELKRYPSVTWLLAHKPVSTVATILTVFAVLMAVYSAGLFRILGTAFGVNLSSLP